VSPLLFILAQVFLGLPAIFVGATSLIGALQVIAWLLAWIGATLAVAVGATLFGKASLELPAVFPVRVSEQRTVPDGYQDVYKGFPYRLLMGGQVEALTADGPRRYRNWAEFVKAIEH
jgi:hypothetical protein